MLIQVAIQRPLHQVYDYRCREQIPAVGCRVLAPFGYGQAVGLVVKQIEKSDYPIEKIKYITRILDEFPLVDADLLRLLIWSSRYYYHPVGEVCFSALPPALRKARTLPVYNEWSITEKGQSIDIKTLKRAPRQRELFDLLLEADNQRLSEDDLKQCAFKHWKASAKQLEKKELLQKKERSVALPLAQEGNTETPKVIKTCSNIELTQEQKEAVQDARLMCDMDKPQPMLLHGVTGSGKTEVYLQLIEFVLAQGKQALFLVPEISLTPQLVGRFQGYFPKQNIQLLHSARTQTQRLHSWLAAWSGEADIVIGTRSAIFTPLPRLGVIVLDEEHDLSFKQHEGFRYHARDLAVKRCHDLKLAVLLGSGTPSLESLYNVKQGRYALLRLRQRPAQVKPPKIQVKDIRGIHLEAGLSKTMLESIETTLAEGNQAMMFLNRRGFAPILFCQQCGWHAHCPSCDANMTYHAGKQQLRCHHCGFERWVDQRCQGCGSDDLSTQGQGTERLEQVLNKHFAHYPVIRIDRDTIKHKEALEKRLAEVQKGEPCVLLGTQMLAKGHDFPRLTLVGLIDVDQALFSTDFRAPERLAQLIVQVAGRAGRSQWQGTVILQTRQGEHPLLQALLKQGYTTFAEHLLQEREQFEFPPYWRQAIVRAEAKQPQRALDFLLAFKQHLQNGMSQETHLGTSPLRLLGPAPSPMEKRADRYRAQLLISASTVKHLHLQLQFFLRSNVIEKHLERAKVKGITWSLDIDPVALS